MAAPDLVGERVVLVPMWLEQADLLARWLGVPRPAVLARWPPVFFDDAFPQKGRAYAVEAHGAAVGAVLHHEVRGAPRAVRVELVRHAGLDAAMAADALRTLAGYVARALGVRALWAELAPTDAAGLEAFVAAGFRITAEDAARVRLERAASSTRPK